MSDIYLLLAVVIYYKSVSSSTKNIYVQIKFSVTEL
jgi:hypothetical protein